MTTGKILLIILSVLVAGTVMVVVFVGAVVLFTLYSFEDSDAAVTYKEFLTTIHQLKQEIVDIKDFGTFVSGNVSISNGNGTATLGLKVIGTKRSTNATVELLYTSGRPWRVTSASFENEAGQNVDLLNPYDSFLLTPTLAA